MICQNRVAHKGFDRAQIREIPGIQIAVDKALILTEAFNEKTFASDSNRRTECLPA